MPTPMGFELLKQIFKKPGTNVFPVTYYPDSILKLLEKVEKGEAKRLPNSQRRLELRKILDALNCRRNLVSDRKTSFKPTVAPSENL